MLVLKCGFKILAVRDYSCGQEFEIEASSASDAIESPGQVDLRNLTTSDH